MRLPVLALSLVACATPYQPMAYSGGYSDKRLPNGDRIVTVKVNGFTDRGTALEYLHRRADELCPNGYDLKDRSDDDNGNVWQNTKKPEVNAVVRCKPSKAAIDALAARDEAKRYEREKKAARKVEPAVKERGFFCASAAMTGFCVRSKAECVRTRDVSLGALPDMTECTLTERAWCFGDRCAPTAEICETVRARSDDSACVDTE